MKRIDGGLLVPKPKKPSHENGVALIINNLHHFRRFGLLCSGLEGASPRALT